MHQVLEEKRFGIAAACRRHKVSRLDVFGSAARGTDFDVETSDADFLVDFDPDYGADEFFGLKDDLEKVLGRPVDLVTRNGLEAGHNHIVRRNILVDRQNVYER